MKKSELKKLIGSIIKPRPPVRRVEVGFDGRGHRILPCVDYNWEVEVSPNPKTAIRIHCLATGHFVDLGNDGVYESRRPNFLILKFQLTMTNDRRVLMEPLPDPRTRYARVRSQPQRPAR